MNHPYFKTLIGFVIFLLLLVDKASAQVYPNDSCKNATSLPVPPNKVFQSFTMNHGYLEDGTPRNYHCLTSDEPPIGDVWFKATMPEYGLLLHFKKTSLSGTPVFEIFHGSCGALVYDTCYRYYTGDSLTYLFQHPVGTEMFV
ncbi:MAG: hypothetical protein V4543_06170, partial [Bacteroidota bacterium]